MNREVDDMDAHKFSIKSSLDKSGKPCLEIVENDTNEVVMTGINTWLEAKRARDVLNGKTKSAVVTGRVAVRQ